MQEDILGYPVTKATLDICLEQIIRWMKERKQGKYMVCANPHSLQVAAADSIFSESMQNAALVIPDGIGIVIASKILGGGIRKRVTGYDIFEGVSYALNNLRGHSYFFLGSTRDTLEDIQEKMKRDFPNIKVAGVYSPPYKDEFSEEENRQMIKAINNVAPDVLWVGITAPKQEKWIYKNKDKLNVKFIGAIGAVFDFYSGKVKRSNPLFQKIGLEWLPRLMREPRRLWKRNIISSPLFLIHVMKCRLKVWLKL